MTRFKQWAVIPVALVASVAALVGLAASRADAIVGGQPVAASHPYTGDIGSLNYDPGDGSGWQHRCGTTEIARFPDRVSVTTLAGALHVQISAQRVSGLVGTSWWEINSHCVTQLDPVPSPAPLPTSALQIGYGSVNRSEQSTVPVEKVIVHPWWNWGMTTGPDGQVGDVSLLVTPIVPARPAFIGPSRLGEVLRAYGWGYTTVVPGTEPLPDQLNELDMTVVPDSGCANAQPGPSAGEVCLRNPTGTLCFGDSGTGAQHDGMLIGSASRIEGDPSGNCAIGGAVETDVSYYGGWIVTSIVGTVTVTPGRVAAIGSAKARVAAYTWSASFRASLAHQ